MKIIASIPVLGRHPLLRLTIDRLYDINKVDRVICSGDEEGDRYIVEACGAEWVKAPNKPLGRKWNMAIAAARKYNPDAILFVGSSDWLSANWLSRVSKDIDKYDLIGKKDCYFAQLYPGGLTRAIFWGGYGANSPRANEPIGIGRLISARSLDKLDWSPANDTLDNSMDGSTMGRILGVGGKLQLVEDMDILSLSIGTWKWPNKHIFNQEAAFPTARSINEQERVRIGKEFPELLKIFRHQDRSRGVCA